MNEMSKMRKWFLVDLESETFFYAPMDGYLPDTESILKEHGEKFTLVEYYNESIIYEVSLHGFGCFSQPERGKKELYHNLLKGEQK
jgi:hypothetical protein